MAACHDVCELDKLCRYKQGAICKGLFDKMCLLGAICQSAFAGGYLTKASGNTRLLKFPATFCETLRASKP